VKEPDYYPTFISLDIEHSDDVPAERLAVEYARCMREAGRGEIVAYSLPGMDGENIQGTERQLKEKLQALRPDQGHFFALVMSDEMEMIFSRGTGGRKVWDIDATYRSEDRRPDVAWMGAMTSIAMQAVRIQGFHFAVLRRDRAWTDFMPEPPLARTNHVVTTTEAQVAERYDDPGAFFSMWDRVEKVGDVRVCIRGLDCLTEHDWLAKTFESTMELARIAKPKLTYYNVPHFHKPFAAWWEYGDLISEEKAGYPALTLSGYDPRTKTLEFAGYITNTPLERGGRDPRHVLIREIHEVRWIVGTKKDRAGNPVDCVRIVFPEEWMARRERRPLLDVGARVFFMDRRTGNDIEIDD
jgi:hypothetical protein